MNDLSGYRPFRLTAFKDAIMGGGLYSGAQLIIACQLKHLGFVEARPSSKGAVALADWLIAKADFLEKPVPGCHPLNSGTTMERILAGDILPEEEFALALAEATEGAVLPEMFGLPSDTGSSASGTSPLTAGAEGKASEPGLLTPAPASAPSIIGDLPPLGVLGGALPAGPLFHPIADARMPNGFVLTGCGIAISLDESTATAMRDALSVGIGYLRGAARERRAAA
ncbi:hypothetical protein [Sphingobium cupriresistens]|uniref:Uncharacterized protein n=1 Tax=Sphingobium cupriresistens LL01 TaxID=1420583 RepID=A0A0J8AJ07_9SPHN|nr:hypothetical protein [Sphingobium cupriresistens]KMS54710.1 hypothetical protein V473_15280 [Sphingobium cupriresistens LL01]